MIARNGQGSAEGYFPCCACRLQRQKAGLYAQPLSSVSLRSHTLPASPSSLRVCLSIVFVFFTRILDSETSEGDVADSRSSIVIVFFLSLIVSHIIYPLRRTRPSPRKHAGLHASPSHTLLAGRVPGRSRGHRARAITTGGMRTNRGWQLHNWHRHICWCKEQTGDSTRGMAPASTAGLPQDSRRTRTRLALTFHCSRLPAPHCNARSKTASSKIPTAAWVPSSQTTNSNSTAHPKPAQSTQAVFPAARMALSPSAAPQSGTAA